MTIRLVVLNDNRGSPGLLNEWGWSVYVEPEGAPPVLFDADSKPEVIEYNSRTLGVDLSGIGFAVLSHEHWDHYGGMSYVARVKGELLVHVPPGLHLWARSAGASIAVNKSGGHLEGPYYLTRPLLVRELMLMEHALIVDDGEHKVLIVGCSHPGVERLAEEAARLVGRPLTLVIGGFHRPDTVQLDVLAAYARYIAPAHCSGDHAVRYVGSKWPERLVLVRTGSTITVENGRVIVEDYHG